jgi:hypothetical protein
MRHVMQKILVCLAALCALSAVMAASALAAQPEWTAQKAFPVPFITTSGPGTLTTAAGNTVACKSDTGTGEITSATEGKKIVIKFKGCKAFGIAPCKTTGGAAEEIITNSLKSKNVYIKKAATTEAGLLLSPESAEAGALYAEFKCEILGKVSTLKVRGSIVAKLTPVNVKTKDFEIVFSEPNGKGSQLPFELESNNGEKMEDTMETASAGSTEFVYEKSGATGSALMLTNEALTLKA